MRPRSIAMPIIALVAALSCAEPAAAWCLYRLGPAGGGSVS